MIKHDTIPPMATNVLVIRPKKIFSLRDLKELWTYRELLYFFSWRDLKVRYKQTAIGIAWAVFQPLITMVVFTVFFGGLAKIPSDGVPYPIFVFVGLLFWQFFSSALSDTSNALVSNQAIITKVYFPRLILPVAVVLTKLVDFAIAALILICMMIYYGFAPNAVEPKPIAPAGITTVTAGCALGCCGALPEELEELLSLQAGLAMTRRNATQRIK